MWWKDFSRSLDYLETRADIDLDRMAYFGSSWGAWMSPLFLGQDKRCNLAVLRLCGFPTWQMNPAYDPFHFASRVRIPLLLINGKYDYLFPHEASQVPFFETWGASLDDKRHVLFETAHNVSGYRNEMIREVLDWLDHYFGPAR